MNTPLSRTARRWILGTLVVGLTVIGGLTWTTVTQDRTRRAAVGLGDVAHELEQTPIARDRDVAGLRDAGLSFPPRLPLGLPKPQLAVSDAAPPLGTSATGLPAIREELKMQALQYVAAPAPEHAPVSAEQAQKLREELRAQGTLPMTIRMPNLREVRQAMPGAPELSPGARAK